MTPNLSAASPGATNSVADIAGVYVGHSDTDGGTSGATVILTPHHALAGVDVRGGGPGTRETDALRPDTTVSEVHAIVLAGGSAFGLAAADGAMQELSKNDIGFQVLPTLALRVPIIPAAVIFDLLVGDATDRATAATGAAAARDAINQYRTHRAGDSTRAQGSRGGGRGASCGVLKGGVGQASLVLNAGPARGYTVASLFIVNAQGSGYDPDTGRLWGDPHLPAIPESARTTLAERGYHGTKIPPALLGISDTSESVSQANTTIGVVITDAPLTKAQAQRMATCGHDGLARSLRPIHMPFDGDTIFGVSIPQQQDSVGTGVDPYTLTALCDAAAVAAERAVVNAITHADEVAGWPAWKDLTGHDPSSREESH